MNAQKLGNQSFQYFNLVSAYIFDSLDAVPPVTLCTLNCDNSVLRSSSCLVNSSFFFPRRSWTLTLP